MIENVDHLIQPSHIQTYCARHIFSKCGPERGVIVSFSPLPGWNFLTAIENLGCEMSGKILVTPFALNSDSVRHGSLSAYAKRSWNERPPFDSLSDFLK